MLKEEGDMCFTLKPINMLTMLNAATRWQMKTFEPVFPNNLTATRIKLNILVLF